MREAAIGKCKPFDGGKLDKVTWEKIFQERDKGWISGPFSAFEMDKMILGQPWIVTRRVPLQQKDKVRLIDDCLSSGLNSAFSAANKLRLMAVDTLVMALFLCISGRHAVGFGCCQSPHGCMGAMILFDVCFDVWIHSGGVCL